MASIALNRSEQKRRTSKARRKAIGTRVPILIEARANARRSLDFVHDQFACRRRFAFMIIAVFHRQPNCTLAELPLSRM